MHKGNKGFRGSSLPPRLQVADIPQTCSRPVSSPLCHCCSPTAALTQKGNRLGCSKFSHMEKRQYWCIAQPYTRGCSLPWHSRQQAGGGQVVGACPHSQTGCDARGGWGTPAGLLQSAQGEEIVRRWRCQVGTAPAGAELGFGALTAAVTHGECSRAGPGTVNAVLQSPALSAATVTT